ncbi:DnaJ domain-containing protein [candidate division WOR-3 bacterium]|nr:DnaJ domain-containing protein [candidate division WOR-3 bacterium]
MENYYKILGISKNATSAEIKKVYLALAQKYHPDRFTDEAEKQNANEVFSRVTAAYRTLIDEKLRTKYDASLAKRSTEVDEVKEIQARNIFNRALEHISRDEHWPALNLLRTAYTYDPKPLYLSFLGLMQVYTKRNVNDGFKKLEHAVKIELFNPVMHCNLGLALESAGRKKEALRAYQQALTWNSKYTQAKQGVERLNRPKKGFFGLFRKK